LVEKIGGNTMKKKNKEELRQANDAIYGGALTLQSTRLLKDRSLEGLVGTTEGFVGIGVAGAVSNVAFNMVSPPKKKKKRRN